VRADGLISEKLDPETRAGGDLQAWVASRAGAWLSPTGEVHKLGKLQTHMGWVFRNQHLIPDEHKVFLHGDDRSPNALVASETADAMITKHGWVRQADKQNYYAGSHLDVPRIVAHVKANFPKVRHIGVKMFRGEFGDPQTKVVEV
jgi:hypothetical protein